MSPDDCWVGVLGIESVVTEENKTTAVRKVRSMISPLFWAPDGLHRFAEKWDK